MTIQHWLMKSEPHVFSIEDLKRKRRAPWDGVRNFQARNFMRDQMKIGDAVLFYHSSADPSGVAGLARVCSAPHPDVTQWDRKSSTFDPRANKVKPIWWLVDLEFVEKFSHFIPLAELHANPRLEGMMVLKKGTRLSIQPVSPTHFDAIVKLGRSVI